MSKIVDDNGFWEYKETLLTREGVFQYSGKQIDQGGRFGLNPNKLYNVYRPANEVCSEDFINSLQNLPLVNDHTMIGEDFTPAEKKGVDGVMYDVHVDEKQNGVVRGSIKVFSEKMKSDIKSGKRELSLGYKCSYRREMGMFGGEPYDFVQFGLVANHIALVDAARMGSDCRVCDSVNCYDSLEITMPDEKKSCVDELIEQLKGCSDEDIAKVRDFLAGSAEKEDPAKDAEPPKENDNPEDKPANDAEPPKDDEKKDEKKEDEESCKDSDPAPAMDADEVRKTVAAEYGKAVDLANKCKAAGITISMDGLYTEKDVAVKVCALDGVKIDVPEEGAIAALKGYLAGRGNRSEKFVTQDSAPVRKSGYSFLAAYKAK